MHGDQLRPISAHLLAGGCGCTNPGPLPPFSTSATEPAAYFRDEALVSISGYKSLGWRALADTLTLWREHWPGYVFFYALGGQTYHRSSDGLASAREKERE